MGTQLVENRVKQQRAQFLAFLVFLRRQPYTPEELCRDCAIFSTNPAELWKYCELPKAPLRLQDGLVCVTEDFKTLLNQQGNCLEIFDPLPFMTQDALGNLGVDQFQNIEAQPHKLEASPAEPLDIPLKGISATAPLNEFPIQFKHNTRDSKPLPSFQDFEVEGEIGSGGYGTVYKVLRKADARVLAIKCPLAKTHRSCVENEVKMLKRLRGKDFIIQIEGEVRKLDPKPEGRDEETVSKLSSKPEGGDQETKCIVLEFIEHDKPEALIKEITIEELKDYCTSLFKALAQLHKENILHLDVKPGNFLFSRSKKRGCLVDFNLARDASGKLPNKKAKRCGDGKVMHQVKGAKRCLDGKVMPHVRGAKGCLDRQVMPQANPRILKRLAQLKGSPSPPAKGVCSSTTVRAVKPATPTAPISVSQNCTAYPPAKRMRLSTETGSVNPGTSTTPVCGSQISQQLPQSRSGPIFATHLKLPETFKIDDRQSIRGNALEEKSAAIQETKEKSGLGLGPGPRPQSGHPSILKYIEVNNLFKEQSLVCSPPTQRKGVAPDMKPAKQPVIKPSTAKRVQTVFKPKSKIRSHLAAYSFV